MAECVPSNLGGPDRRPKQRQYFPSSMTRFAMPNLASTDKHAPIVAEYSPLISVAYTSAYANPKANLLLIGFERRNDELWQSPKAEESASACRAGTDPGAAWRWPRSAVGRAGSPARPSRRAGGVRGGNEGTPHNALLTWQEDTR